MTQKIVCQNENVYAIIKIIMERNVRLLVILGVGIVGGFALVDFAGSASAITYQNSTNVEFTFNPTINVSLSSADLMISNLSPGGTADSNIITATVSTNAGYGYYLSATTGTAGGSTSLVNSADNTYSFTNLSSNAATLSVIPDDKWGYSYSTDNGATWVSGDNGSALSGYNGLPLDNDDSGATGVKLLSSDSFAGSGSVQFKIGARASSSQAAGTYTGTVNFYAVTNPAPVTFNEAYANAGKEKLLGYYQMQDATPAICTAVDEGQVGQVIDSRDNAVYHIGKLADGNCWLLDNLALDLTNSTILNGMNGNNTNASNTTLGYLKGTTTRDPSTNPNGQYATAGVSNWGSSNSYSAPLVNISNKDVIPSDSTSQAGQYKVGGYYNYCAATAGSYCYGNGTSVGTSAGDATEDICPKGWRMPTGNTNGEYNTLYINSSYNTYATYRSALRLPLSGFFESGIVKNLSNTGTWWTTTRNSNDYVYKLRVYTNSINPTYTNSRYYGNFIRCILDS